MKLKIYLLVFVFMISLAGSALASFDYIGNSIQKNYSGGDNVKGLVYFSFNNQNANSSLTSNFGGNASLIDLIRTSNLILGVDYFCSTVNCDTDYIAQNPGNIFNVPSGVDGKLLGFKITGSDIQITEARFNLSSNVQASCSNQFFVDLLDDSEDVIINTNHNGQSCGVVYSGCYSGNGNEATIQNDREYCEKMTLPSAPAFFVGARIRNGTGGYSPIEMSLIEVDSGNQIGTCTLPKHSQNVQSLKCIIEHFAPVQKEYYACVTSETNVGYKIGWETEVPRCGTVVGGTGQGFSSLENDFEIFAESVQFAASSTLAIDDFYYENNFGDQISFLFDNYISQKYGRDCQNYDCVIPLRVFGQQQTNQFSGVNINYESNGIPSSSNQVYEVNFQDSLIDADNISVDLDFADFVLPLETSEDSFELYIDNVLVFNEDISVTKSFGFDVTPRVVAFGQNVLFSIDSNETILNSEWNFGDGSSTQNVQGSQISHIYTSQTANQFDLTVTARNSDNLTASRSFVVFIGDPKELANETIIKYKSRLNNLSSQITNYPEWIRSALSEKLDVESLDSKLGLIENSYASAFTEDDYQKVMLDLIKLKVPYGLELRQNPEFPISVSFNSINVNYIERISNEEADSKTEIKNRIVGRMNENFDSVIVLETVNALFDTESEVLLSKFKIETKPLSSSNDNTYLIFGQDIETSGGFRSIEGINSLSDTGVSYVLLDTFENEVFEFYIVGDISAENLGVYISQEVDTYDLGNIDSSCNLNNICESGETETNCPEDCSKKARNFTIWSWIFLILAALVVYVILQEWYKRHYQKHLFPKETDLYNIVNFIHNARRSGLSDDDIRAKLKASKWDNEKITYAFKKIDGKRLGMFEIPIFKFLEKKKVKKEIAKRQVNQPRSAGLVRSPINRNRRNPRGFGQGFGGRRF